MDRFTTAKFELNNKYDYIFVDEYQDAFPEVVEILLDFLTNSKTTNRELLVSSGIQCNRYMMMVLVI